PSCGTDNPDFPLDSFCRGCRLDLNEEPSTAVPQEGAVHEMPLLTTYAYGCGIYCIAAGVVLAIVSWITAPAPSRHWTSSRKPSSLRGMLRSRRRERFWSSGRVWSLH